jgi:1-deoxyxylulose-5-phosphate synthase
VEYAHVGRSGLVVSRVGLGMMGFGDPAVAPWYLDADRAEPVVRRAVEGGVTFFDTADSYSGGASERITGALLRRLFRRREEYVLATKAYYPTGSGPNERGLSRVHILAAVDASLRRLGVDHIDLYQVHRWDPATPVEETAAALADVVAAGKVRYVGASLMYAWQLAMLYHRAPVRPVSMQTRYSLLYREEEREVLPFCADRRIGVLAYSPLAQGMLARDGDTARSPEVRAGGEPAVLAAVRAVAGARGLAPATVALAWLLARPAVTAPLVGVTKVAQLDAVLAAVDTRLDGAETAALEAPYRPREPYGYT